MKIRVLLFGLVTGLWSLPNTTLAFDFEHGNAAIEVVIPTVAPVIFTDVSPTGGDATLVLRVTTLTTNAWFDAIAPYHPTAVGVYSSLGRRSAVESANNRNMNIALLYASYRVFNSLIPQKQEVWRKMLSDLGLDSDNDSSDLNTPEGIGNKAGLSVVNAREHDGMNQMGDEGGNRYNLTPYADYTSYRPVNTAYRLLNPSRWQPDIQRLGIGLYKVQQFVTPQYAKVKPYSYKSPEKFHVKPPFSSNHRNFKAYKAQADEVLAASANLTDEQKMKAELYDNKIRSLGFSAVAAAQDNDLTLMQFIQFDFLTNMAAHDAGIFVWQEKRKYDAVRPFSAIRYIYGKKPVTAWGGPGKETVSDLPANQWISYLEEADHPEYPSASTCFCNAHAQAARLFLGSDNLNWVIPVPAGSSRIEPGITPAKDINLSWETWTQFAEECGQSRLWAGVHFQPAIDASAQICSIFGDKAYDYLSALISGHAVSH